MPVQLGDDVAGLEAGLGGWRSRHDLVDDRAGGGLEAEVLGDVLAHRLDLDPEIAARDAAAMLERRLDVLTVVAGMAKPMPTLPPEGE